MQKGGSTVVENVLFLPDKRPAIHSYEEEENMLVKVKVINLN